MVRKEGDEMWTNIMLAVIVLMGMLYGLYLMLRVDNFMQEEHVLQERQLMPQEEILQAVVFGKKDEVDEVKNWFQGKGIEPLGIEEICIQKEWTNVQWVIALSDSDTDNLSLCNLLKKMYHTNRVFSVCNEKINEAVYRRFEINVLEENGRFFKQLDAALSGNEVHIA